MTTIEGLADGDELHPMQRAFIEHDAFQCGYCTSGQIMSAVKLIEEGNAATDEDIAEYMSGNICRCAAYPNIRAAIRDVRDGAAVRPLSVRARERDVEDAIALVAGDPASAFLAGGTTEVDLIRAGDRRAPTRLVDINALPLDGVEETADGGLRIGALARMSDVARTPGRRRALPGDLAGAPARRLRAAAQHGLDGRQPAASGRAARTCATASRRATSASRARGCAALDGFNRGHAILGTSEHCIATHPSDVAVALSRSTRSSHTLGPDGARTIAVDDFFLAAGRHAGARAPARARRADRRDRGAAARRSRAGRCT